MFAEIGKRPGRRSVRKKIKRLGAGGETGCSALGLGIPINLPAGLESSEKGFKGGWLKRNLKSSAGLKST